MIPFLPKQIATRSIWIYLGTLAAVSLLLFHYAMGPEFITMGIVWVVGFFLLSAWYSQRWQSLSVKRFSAVVFLVALGLRVVWVLFSYWFFTASTGIPFEFAAGDSVWYYTEAVGNIRTPWRAVWNYLFTDSTTVSDSGYVFYLTFLAKIFGDSILLPRLVNSVLGAGTCVQLYYLAKRNIGEEGGRLAAILPVSCPT